MDRRNLNRNQKYKRKNNRRNDGSLKEQIKDFKETFVKAKELGSSLIVLEEVYYDTP